MQIELVVLYSDLEDYKKGLSIKAVPRGHYAESSVHRVREGDHLITVHVGIEEVISHAVHKGKGMDRGEYDYYMIKKNTPVQPPKTEYIEVQTEGGKITANVAADPSYPGIYLAIDGHELLLMEYDQAAESVILRAWSHKDPDGEPVYRQPVLKGSL